ncbi:MAG TPA: ester cyclase [Kofleriaceae bacterium]
MARRYITEIWGKGNTDLIDELVDENIVLRDPMSAKPAQGKEAFKQRVEMMAKGMDDNTMTIQELVVAGDVVVVRDRWSGVSKEDFFGVPAKGKRMTTDAVEWIRIKNGKVVENISYFDIYTMFQQLGALPAPDQFKPEKPAIPLKPARA